MATGTATINLGSRSAMKKYAEVDITGLVGLLPSTHMEAWMQGDTTADHTSDEHMLEIIHLRMKYLTASSARVIAQVDRGVVWGDFTIHYTTL